MFTQSHKGIHRRLVVGAAIAAGAFTVAALPAGAGQGNSTTIGTGPDDVYPGGDALASADATVSAGALGSGNSQITLSVDGVVAPAGTRFGAHVHQFPCGATGADAGPHYATSGGKGPLKNQEVWLDFTVNANGSGHAVATRHFDVTDRANRSVIIHVMGTEHGTGAAGARLACIDLDS